MNILWSTVCFSSHLPSFPPPKNWCIPRIFYCWTYLPSVL